MEGCPFVIFPLFFSAADQTSCTFRIVEENGLGEGKPDFLAFSQEMVAEQFTLMDAVSIGCCLGTECSAHVLGVLPVRSLLSARACHALALLLARSLLRVPSREPSPTLSLPGAV